MMTTAIINPVSSSVGSIPPTTRISETLYLIFAIFSGIYGGFLSVVMRMELQDPGLQYFADPHVYNVFHDRARF